MASDLATCSLAFSTAKTSNWKNNWKFMRCEPTRVNPHLHVIFFFPITWNVVKDAECPNTAWMFGVIAFLAVELCCLCVVQLITRKSIFFVTAWVTCQPRHCGTDTAEVYKRYILLLLDLLFSLPAWQNWRQTMTNNTPFLFIMMMMRIFF